jgi:hypothetical protein
VSLRIPSSSRSLDHDPHRTIYYLGYPIGRFAGLKHRQLARQVGVIITTGRIRRTLVNKINLLVDSPRSIKASRLALVKAESIFLRRASGCLSTSRGSSRGSSCRSSSTTPRHTAHPAARRQLLRVTWLVPRLVVPLVIDYPASRRLVIVYFASASRGSSHGSSRRSSATTPPRAGSSSTTSPPQHVRVPQHVAWLVTRPVAPIVVDYSASLRLVVDYFASTTHSGASARRATCHAARRAARRRLLRLRRASGCLGTSRGLSRGSSRRSSSTTPPRVG